MKDFPVRNPRLISSQMKMNYEITQDGYLDGFWLSYGLYIQVTTNLEEK